jgi:hypothetical protein
MVTFLFTGRDQMKWCKTSSTFNHFNRGFIWILYKWSKEFKTYFNTPAAWSSMTDTDRHKSVFILFYERWLNKTLISHSQVIYLCYNNIFYLLNYNSASESITVQFTHHQSKKAANVDPFSTQLRSFSPRFISPSPQLWTLALCLGAVSSIPPPDFLTATIEVPSLPLL